MKTQNYKISWATLIIIYLGLIGLSQLINATDPVSRLLYNFSFILFLPIFFVAYQYRALGFTLLTVSVLITQQVIFYSVYHKISFLFSLLLVPGFMGFAFREKKRIRTILIQSTILLFVGKMLLIYGIQKEEGFLLKNIIEQFSQSLVSEVKNTAAILPMWGVGAQEVEGVLKQTQNWIVPQLPAVFFLTSAVQAFIYYIAAVVFLRVICKIKNKKLSMPTLSLSKIDLGKGYEWAFLATLLGVMLINENDPYVLYRYTFINIFILFLCLFVVQGLSFSLYLIQKNIKLHGGLVAVIFIIGFVFLGQQLIIVLSIVGLMDIFFDFRNLRHSISS